MNVRTFVNEGTELELSIALPVLDVLDDAECLGSDAETKAETLYRKDGKFYLLRTEWETLYGFEDYDGGPSEVEGYDLVEINADEAARWMKRQSTISGVKYVEMNQMGLAIQDSKVTDGSRDVVRGFEKDHPQEA